ncbi:hypothetical protein AMECASPLE_009326 [Ameca splendens]|uniref:Uncharacterized protein n=1 Tax=Ameca splendens TaxID=208324 RepID=A0ABV0ZKR2_9TELE
MEWKPRGRRQLVFSLGMINHLLKEAVETVWLPVSLMSCSEECGNSSPEPPLCFKLQTQLLRSRLSPTINLPVHPPTLTLQLLWSFPEEKKTQAKEDINSPHKTVHILSASGQRGKGLITPPALPRSQPHKSASK